MSDPQFPPRRPPTSLEHAMLRALRRACLGFFDKRWVSDAMKWGGSDGLFGITEKQAACLRRLVIRYRRQIPPTERLDLVALARIDLHGADALLAHLGEALGRALKMRWRVAHGKCPPPPGFAKGGEPPSWAQAVLTARGPRHGPWEQGRAAAIDRALVDPVYCDALAFAWESGLDAGPLVSGART